MRSQSGGMMPFQPRRTRLAGAPRSRRSCSPPWWRAGSSSCTESPKPNDDNQGFEGVDAGADADATVEDGAVEAGSDAEAEYPYDHGPQFARHRLLGEERLREGLLLRSGSLSALDLRDRTHGQGMLPGRLRRSG